MVKLSIYESEWHCSQWNDHLSSNCLSQNPQCEAHTLRPNCLSTVHQLFINCSSAVYQLFINCSSAVHQLFINCLSTVHQAQHPQMSPPYMQQQLGAEERVSNTEPIPPHFNQPGGKRGETEHRGEAGLRFHGAGLSTHWDSGFKTQDQGV